VASDVFDNSRLVLGGLRDFATCLVAPRIRLGITGLSRSGKTVFITSLVNALLRGTSLPLFEAQARGRILRAYLEPQPDDDMPRFAFEDHIAKLTAKEPAWPESTTRMSQLRLTIEYAPQKMFARYVQRGKLHIDIVDYPGEWLLDLPLMTMTYAQWSATTVAASRKEPRATVARDWHAHMASLNADAAADELQAITTARLFTDYLAACRNEALSLSTLPPGRFLLPGELANSPLLTFAPLDIPADHIATPNSLAALMARRYDSYVKHVVKPFFYGHFARLDRQIVLVDVLSTLNAGPSAVSDLSTALQDVLKCFRTGSNSVLSELFGRRIDRILFAATKADQLHHTSHDRLEAILRHILNDAIAKAEFAGAACDASAIAAIRATREATVRHHGEELKSIAGTPQAGEAIGSTKFDGKTEAIIFPGDLPENPEHALDGSVAGKFRSARFRPPSLTNQRFPHIRMDRAIEYLIGDSFQ
jgi:uncharacterized protein